MGLQGRTPGRRYVYSRLTLGLSVIAMLCLTDNVQSGEPPAPQGWRPPTSWVWETAELTPQVRLPSVDAIYSSPFDWSADGSVLLFVERHDLRSEISAISLRTRRKHSLVETTGRIASLCGAFKIEQHGTQNHRFTLDEFKARYTDAFGSSF